MLIEILKGKGKWYWKIIAQNGECLAHSETYSSRAKALQTARLFISDGIKFGIKIISRKEGKKWDKASSKKS